MNTLVKAIWSLVPEAKFGYTGEDVDSIVWGDSRTKPSRADILSAIATLQPMEDWKASMSATDSSMPRWFEDYVTENNVTLATGKAKDNYDAKVLLRSQKP